MVLFPRFRRGGARKNIVMAFAILALIGLGQFGASASTTLSPGPNVNVSFLTENQPHPAVAINPANPMYAVCFHDQSGPNYGVLGNVTTDGGASWAPIVQSTTLAYTSLAWDNLGNLFLTAGTDTGTDVAVFVSTDGAQSFI